MFFEVGCCRFDIFFKQGDNAEKWTVVNNAAITADSKGISEWLEDITFNQTIETRFASGNPNKVEFFYDNQKIATADKDGTIETFDNGLKEGDYTDADIIAPQYGGNKGIVCVQRGGAKLCGIAGGACFVAGTLVQTPTGAKNIETIQAGDTIIAYDTKQQKNVYSKVRQTFKRGVTQLYQVIIGKDTLNTTAEHPFYTTKGWQPAIQLKKGMKILTLASALLAVDTVVAFDSLATVYNFEVAEQHNYFVGEEGVLVHNSYSFKLKFLEYLSEIQELTNLNPYNRNTVWRVLRPDQSSTSSIYPKNGSGLTGRGTPFTVEGHVGTGSRTSTPYISSFADMDGAIQRGIEDGLEVVEIDLTKFEGVYIDLSVESVRNSLIKNPRTRNFAEASSEFLIVVEEIPAKALTKIE